jgi:hypothetical protein
LIGFMPLTVYVRLGLAVLAILAATVAGGCDVAQPQQTSFVEIYWTVLSSPVVASDPYAGRQLRMRIPKAHVRQIIRDPEGEAGKIRGVKNNGIGIISLEAWLPDLSPSPLVGDIKSTSDEQKRSLFNRQLMIDLTSGIRGQGKSRYLEGFYSQAKKGMVYRLPDLYGMERFRRMACDKNSDFDPTKSHLERESPPNGCWHLPADEYLITKDREPVVSFTCAGPGGRCIMRSHFQSLWTMQIIFPYSRLESWKELKGEVEKLLNKFVIS